MKKQADWYPDPHDPTMIRFHDGSDWTEWISRDGVTGLLPVGPAVEPRQRAHDPVISFPPPSGEAVSLPPPPMAGPEESDYVVVLSKDQRHPINMWKWVVCEADGTPVGEGLVWRRQRALEAACVWVGRPLAGCRFVGSFGGGDFHEYRLTNRVK